MPGSPHSNPDARLLRLAVDGELSDADRQRAQALLHGNGPESEAARQLAQDERRLQEAVGRVMASATAPAALRSQVEELLAAAPADAIDVQQEAIAGRIERGGVATSPRQLSLLERLFSSPKRANFAAVAAVLALIAGAVLFGIYGRTIDDVPVRQPVDVVGNAALYVDGEHTECTTSIAHIQEESVWHTRSEAELGMTELLGAPVRAFDLSSLGYEFVGAGRCDVPLERQPSGHLIYRKMTNGRSGPMASVFMAPVRGCCKSICADLRPGEWRIAKSPGKRRVVYSTDGRLVYFLVCCDERDQPRIGEAISLAPAADSR